MLQVVESDKADMDVESFAAGTLAFIVVPEGGEAGVGSDIAYIAETEADVEPAKAKGAAGGGGGAGGHNAGLWAASQSSRNKCRLAKSGSSAGERSLKSRSWSSSSQYVAFLRGDTVLLALFCCAA